jgi:RNA polymerase sigma factor (sigma-70 family)
MATQPEPGTMNNHPLLQDRARLDQITKVMRRKIEKTLRVKEDPAGKYERVIAGGASCGDVLQDALLGLLRFPQSRLKGTWEALAVRIAQFKAIDALEEATRGRKRKEGEDDGDEIDEVRIGALGDDELAALAELGADDYDEYVALAQEDLMIQLARDLLDERDRRVFYGRQYLGVPKAELARELGLSGPGVADIYARALRRLEVAARSHPAYKLLSAESAEGGSDDQTE